ALLNGTCGRRRGLRGGVYDRRRESGGRSGDGGCREDMRLTKTLLLALLLLVCIASARATDITLSAFQTPPIVHTDQSPYTVRFFASQTFTTSDGKVVLGNISKSPTGFYSETAACTVSGNVLNCPSIV